jgi:DNA-binding SARP family transcriptional activator
LARKLDEPPKALREGPSGRGRARALASFGPSKIAAPRLAETADNERLFLRLDRALDRPVVWVHGPPGSGKTTLVASYAAVRGLRPIWLRLDQGDGEASTLFFYLGLAEAAARGAADGRKLPALRQEYQRGVVAFSHNFFRRLFEGSDPPPIVLDDYHEIAEDSPVHNVLAAGFREIPEAGNVVVLSRGPPPRAFARLRVNGAMEVVPPTELRLTRDEAESIAVARGAPCNEAVIDLAEGWTAGLILLMEAARSGRPMRPRVRPASRELLFDYLSGEVFERMGVQAQRNLMRLSFMPAMTAAAAEKLTGDADASELLESLAARNYFTVRDSGVDPHYRFHPLFRDFLLASAEASFDGAELANVRREAAHALAEAGQPEPAAALLAEAGAWDDLTQLVLYWAPALEREGRHATIAAWIDLLPRDRVESDGWLSDWAGEARLPMTPVEAHPFLMRALDLFEESGDDIGAYLAWAGATEAILHNFSARQIALDESIRRMRELNRRFPDFPSAEIECRVAQAMYLALSRRTNTRVEIALWRRRALAAADAAGAEDVRYISMAYIVVWALHDGDFALARETLAALPPPEAVGDEHLARTLIASATLFAQMHRQAPGSAIDTAHYVLGLENKFGVRAFGAIHANHAARECVRIGDLKQASTWLARAANLAERYRPEGDASGANFNLAYLRHTAGVVALAEGRIDEAIAKMRAGVEAFAQAGIDYAEAHGRLMLAQALLVGQDPAGAAEQASAAEDLLNHSASESLRFPLDLLRAELAIRSGDYADARARLRDALALGRASGRRGSPFLLPTVFSRLCAFALANDIEPDYVRELILLAPLPPPEERIESWPWPLKVITLGAFRIEVNGQPLAPARKAPRRLFEMLKAVLAYGGVGVRREKIIDAIWADEEGDMGRKAFEAAVHRLRRLVGDHQTIELNEGRVGLNRGRSFVDLWAFEEGVAPNASEDERVRALNLYRGEFLAGEDRLAWAEPLRRRLCARFLESTEALADARAKRGDFDGALALWRAAVAACPEAEIACVGLIRRQKAAGLADTARETARQLRLSLEAAGRAPSKASLSLFRSLDD